MHKCWEWLIAKRTKAIETCFLPFPFLITQLLDEDFTVMDFPKFNLQQWTQSTSHLRQHTPTRAEAENVEEIDTTKAMEEDQLGKDEALSREDAAQYEDDIAA